MFSAFKGSNLRGNATRRDADPVRWTLFLLAAAVAMATAGCGGGGGTGATPAGGTISGRVVAPAGSGSNASTQGLSVSLEGSKTSAVVQSDGSFSLPGVPPGSYTLSVRNGDGSLAGHAVVHVSAGMSTPTILDLLPAGQISGIVSQRNSGGTLDPVPGLTVTLASASVEEPPVPIFNPGANPTGPIGVLEGAAAPNEVGSIGSGSGSAGSPPIGAPPPPAQTMPLSLTTTTASNGTYSFTGIPAGLYTVSTSQGSLSASVFVSVSPAQTSAGDMTLMLPVSTTPTQVTGQVTSAGPSSQGQPIAGALIQFETTPTCDSGGVGGGIGGGIAVRGRQAVPPTPTCIGPPLPLAAPVTGVSASGAPALAPFSVLTDAMGNYSWTIPPGITTLVATAQGFLPTRATVTPDSSGKAVVNFQLTVDPAASLKTSLTVDGFGSNPITVAPGTPLSMTLTLSNPGSSPVDVLLSGAGEDLLILDKNQGNGLVWSLNFGKLQPDLAEKKTIPPGNSLVAHVTWPGIDNEGLPLQPGDYVIEGSVAGVTAPPVSFSVAGTPSTTPTGPPTQPNPPPPTIVPIPPSSGAGGSGAGGTGSSGPGTTTSP